MSDYDIACGVTDLAGVINVYGRAAFVINDEPLQTAWVPDDAGGLFVRWRYAPSEQAVVQSLAALPDDLTWEGVGTLDIDDTLILIDSAAPGTDLLEFMEISLLRGEYLIQTCSYEQAEVGLTLHRFTWQSTSI